MNKINAFLKAIFSLGWLGIVLLLLVASILWALFSQVSEPFDATQERMAALNVLESDLEQALNQMKLQEARKIFTLEYGLPEDQDYAQLAGESDAAISDMLAGLEEEGHFDSEQVYISDILPEVQAFNELRAAHRQTFEALIEAFQAEDSEMAYELMEQIQTENEEMDIALRDIIIAVEQDRLDAQRDFPEDINASVFIATSGLALSLLLALAGYQLISASVRPLRTLRNAITAMEGDQYRAEMQAGLLAKKGPAGDLARALDQLAGAIQQRDVGLKVEIDRLRQALYESRRRRLKIYHSTLQEEEKL